jgi:NodT family efflux transporter outer membrane factor (OMF) lipoprotein
MSSLDRHGEASGACAWRVGADRLRAALLTLAPVVTAIASTAMIALAGCANPAGIAPSAELVRPEQLGLAGTDAPATVASNSLAADWWREFGDATLNGLVERALAGNPGLKAAQTRVARAEAVTAAQQANEGLQIGASADTTRQRFSATSIYPPPLGGSIRTLANAQIGASWEFDFFGRNRAALAAALGAQRAALAETEAARVVLAGSVVRGYVQLGRLQAQREVAERALQQREEMLRLIRQRVNGGLDTNVELRQGEGALPESRQQIEQLDEQIALTRNALAALTAQSPDALARLDASLATVRLAALPATVPADLLGRRADISAARWRIEAASADTRSAKAAFYPNINLTAFVGLSSIGLDRLVRSASEQYGAGPAVRLPIFDAGRLRANLRVKTADLDAAVESYNTAVIEALHEAADQIASLRAIARQQAEQVQAQASAEAAYDLAMQRYKAGLSTYLAVLNTETAVLNQRRAAVDLKARALEAQAGLARALGGGYTGEPGDTPSRPAAG